MPICTARRPVMLSASQARSCAPPSKQVRTPKPGPSCTRKVSWRGAATRYEWIRPAPPLPLVPPAEIANATSISSASGWGPGPYQLQAAIAACHAEAASFDATDWKQIVSLYDSLVEL